MCVPPRCSRNHRATVAKGMGQKAGKRQVEAEAFVERRMRPVCTNERPEKKVCPETRGAKDGGEKRKGKRRRKRGKQRKKKEASG